MITLTLPDGATRQFDEPLNGIAFAESISKSLAKKALALKINGEPVDPSNGSTLGFVCDSPEQIQEFHDVAIANGGRSIEDPPGPREGNMGLMYLCYFLDPNGHKICGIHRPA